MVLTVVMEMNAPCNDNEPMQMLPISVAALAILNRLRTTMQLRDLELAEQEIEKPENGTGTRRDEQDGVSNIENNRENIERRLRELSEWENRIAEDRKRLRR